MALRFSPSHVWVRVEGSEAVIGLSEYFHDQLGDLSALELADVGDVIRASRDMGGVESEDASFRIDAPVTGEVLDVNLEALANPDVVNTDPYGQGWLLRVRLDDPTELEDLISEEEYAELTTEV